MMTGCSLLLLIHLIIKHRKLKFQYDNLLPGLMYCCYAFLGFASILWSTDIHFTVLQLLMLFESMAFVFFFYHALILYNKSSGDHAAFSRILALGVTILSIGFLIGLSIDPSTFYRDTHGGAVSRLGGFIINPNELGMLAVIGAVMNYVEISEGRSKFKNGLFWTINVSVLLLTQSRSSLGSFLLITIWFVLRSGNKKLITATIAAGIVVLPILINTIVVKEGDMGEVMSMTGRLPFWSDLITHGFPERPILGYGFMSISPSPFTPKFDSIHAYAASMTHNTFVQVLINLGLVGAFIVLFQMIFTFRALAISKNKVLKQISFAMLVPLIINSATEFGIFGEANYGILFYQLLILFPTVSVIEKERKRRRKLTSSHMNHNTKNFIHL